MLICLVLDEKRNEFYEETYTTGFLERKLTPKEIEEFKIKKDANKYNL